MTAPVKVQKMEGIFAKVDKASWLMPLDYSFFQSVFIGSTILPAQKQCAAPFLGRTFYILKIFLRELCYP